jgi:hypothetical protein
MSSLKERSVFPRSIPTEGLFGKLLPPGEKVVVTDDVTVLATAQITSTGTLTPTRVDTATAGTATGAIAADATDATMAANIQVGIRALGGIYADATCVAGTADTFIITVKGGYDITWATTFTTPTITEAGSAGGVTAVAGSVLYQKELGIGKFAEVKKIVLKGFNDNSLDVDIKDKDGKSVFVLTAIDTSTASADVPYVKLLAADGVAGNDGLAGATPSSFSGVFRGPLVVKVTTSAPAAARAISPRVTLVTRDEDTESAGKRYRERTTGARTTMTGSLSLGSDIAIIKRVQVKASVDTTVAVTLTDADGLIVFNKASGDLTTELIEQLADSGVDQAGNALADTCEVVAKSPLTLSGSGLGSGTFTAKVIVEV